MASAKVNFNFIFEQIVQCKKHRTEFIGMPKKFRKCKIHFSLKRAQRPFFHYILGLFNLRNASIDLQIAHIEGNCAP